MLFDESTEALCLDGTRAGLYFVKGHGTGLNKTALLFYGGDWCNGRDRESLLDDCLDRVRNDKLPWAGTSRKWQDNMYVSYASGDSADDSVYFNWNRIYVKYCDGSGH